jgi:integrase
MISERLGHESVEITLKVYAHVLPTMQKGAADKQDLIFSSPAGEKQAAEGAS